MSNQKRAGSSSRLQGIQLVTGSCQGQAILEIENMLLYYWRRAPDAMVIKALRRQTSVKLTANPTGNGWTIRLDLSASYPGRIANKRYGLQLYWYLGVRAASQSSVKRFIAGPVLLQLDAGLATLPY